MFALEIDFHDGVSEPETIFVRRQHAIIGSAEHAHVVLEGTQSEQFEIRLNRGIGAKFRVELLANNGSGAPRVDLDSEYEGTAEVMFGEIQLRITSLDIDLYIPEDADLEQARRNIFERALALPTPRFPCLAIFGASPVYVSFAEDQPILVGRSRKCALRLDAPDVSFEHTRIGIENDMFWVEDLASTNGTFISGQPVSGRQEVSPGDVVQIGAEFSIYLLKVETDLAKVQTTRSRPQSATQLKRFPCVLSISDQVLPHRYPLLHGMKVLLGRDPANDIWVGASHVSRAHAELMLTEDGSVQITDLSSNGTFVDEARLARGGATLLPKNLSVVDLGSGVSFYVAHTEEQEQAFLKLHSLEELPGAKETRRPRPRRPTKGSGTIVFRNEQPQNNQQLANAEQSLPQTQPQAEAFDALAQTLAGSTQLVDQALQQRAGRRASQTSLFNNAALEIRSEAQSLQQISGRLNELQLLQPSMTTRVMQFAVWFSLGVLIVIGLLFGISMLR
ncbi:FHA domain-containing protein [bacterium]|nr:FHA domain-containing protein [bacterium]